MKFWQNCLKIWFHFQTWRNMHTQETSYYHIIFSGISVTYTSLFTILCLNAYLNTFLYQYNQGPLFHSCLTSKDDYVVRASSLEGDQFDDWLGSALFASGRYLVYILQFSTQHSSMYVTFLPIYSNCYSVIYYHVSVFVELTPTYFYPRPVRTLISPSLFTSRSSTVSLDF